MQWHAIVSLDIMYVGRGNDARTMFMPPGWIKKCGSQINKNRMVPILYDKYLHKSNLAAAVSRLFSSSIGIICKFPTFPQRDCAVFVVPKSHEQEKLVHLIKGPRPSVWGN